MREEQILEKYMIPNDKLISWRKIDSEVIALDKKENVFFELNTPANFIWKKLAAKQKVEKIISSMQKRYIKINKEVLKRDTLNFINDLLKKKYFLLKNE